jgi:hypothetical protein
MVFAHIEFAANGDVFVVGYSKNFCISLCRFCNTHGGKAWFRHAARSCVGLQLPTAVTGSTVVGARFDHIITYSIFPNERIPRLGTRDKVDTSG